LYIIITFGCGFSAVILGRYILSKPELLDEHADITELTRQYLKMFDKENIKKITHIPYFIENGEIGKMSKKIRNIVFIYLNISSFWKIRVN